MPQPRPAEGDLRRREPGHHGRALALSVAARTIVPRPRSGWLASWTRCYSTLPPPGSGPGGGRGGGAGPPPRPPPCPPAPPAAPPGAGGSGWPQPSQSCASSRFASSIRRLPGQLFPPLLRHIPEPHGGTVVPVAQSVTHPLGGDGPQLGVPVVG